MQYISKLFILLSFLFMAQATTAQPPAHKKEKTKKENRSENKGTVLSERAKSQYPGNVTPQEVDWKREVYRELDLSKEKNASLYFPVEPIGGSMNLFTYLFKNVLDGNITAYKYNLDGYEQFTEGNILAPKELLENNSIYYEEENGKYFVGKSDIPSAEVLSYFIKESHYYDQRTGTYGRRITAICPVMHRSDEFAFEKTKFPLFWLNYDEIAPLLTRQTVVTSSLNNVAAMTFSDYFNKGCYEGEIYRTINMQNLAISQYCKDSVAVKKEQEKIEQQLSDFRTNLWNTKTIAEIEQDSINAAIEAKRDSIDTADGKKTDKKKTTRKTKKKEDKKEEKKVKKNDSGTKPARASVRRTRR
jgi:gliding motility associated protien GldN